MYQNLGSKKSVSVSLNLKATNLLTANKTHILVRMMSK